MQLEYSVHNRRHGGGNLRIACVRDVMLSSDIVTLKAGDDRERAAETLIKYDLLAIPVLDSKLISELMEASLHMQRPAWARHVRRRIRELLEASRA